MGGRDLGSLREASGNSGEYKGSVSYIPPLEPLTLHPKPYTPPEP